VRHLYTIFFLVMIFFGVHTGLAIQSGGTLIVPFVMAGIGGTGILIVRRDKIKQRFAAQASLLVGVIIALALVATVSTGDLTQHFISSTLFMYSLYIAYTCFVAIEGIRRRTLSRLFLGSALLLIVGSALEVYGPLRPISDDFRQVANAWQPGNIYHSSDRDMEDYGEIRPNFFASEPSILGIMTGLSIVFWFLSSVRFPLRRVIIASILAAAAFSIIRSPTILIAWIMIFVYWVSELGLRRATSRGRNAVLIVSGLIFIFIVPTLVASVSSFGKTGSYFARELAPPLIAGSILRLNPLFGVGIGGWDALSGTAMQVYSSSGAFSRHPEFFSGVISGALGPKQLMSNSVWEFWISFGIVGGIAVLWLIWRIFRSLGVPNVGLVICTAAMIFTASGGINTPRGWIGICCIAALYKKHLEAQESENAEAETESAATQNLVPAS
jgi:hypothetical protein